MDLSFTPRLSNRYFRLSHKRQSLLAIAAKCNHHRISNNNRFWCISKILLQVSSSTRILMWVIATTTTTISSSSLLVVVVPPLPHRRKYSRLRTNSQCSLRNMWSKLESKSQIRKLRKTWWSSLSEIDSFRNLTRNSRHMAPTRLPLILQTKVHQTLTTQTQTRNHRSSKTIAIQGNRDPEFKLKLQWEMLSQRLSSPSILIKLKIRISQVIKSTYSVVQGETLMMMIQHSKAFCKEWLQMR